MEEIHFLIENSLFLLDIKAAIVSFLADNGSKYDKKALCKAVMKPFKSSYDSKDDRKEAFSNALSSLIKKQKIVDNGDSVQVMVEKDKKSKKRKVDSSDDNSNAPENSNKQAKTEEIEPIVDKVHITEDDNSQHATAPEKKVYPKPTGDVTILLFYAYCTPQMTRGRILII